MTFKWKLNEQGYFEAPGLAALVYHNDYQEGKQGGVEIIQHGERILSCGDLRLATAPGQWGRIPVRGERTIDRGDENTHTGARVEVSARFPDLAIEYAVRVEPEGAALRVTVDLHAPLPEELQGRLGFNLEIYPGSYFGKGFCMGGAAGDAGQAPEAWACRTFPRQANGPRLQHATGGDEEQIWLAPMATGARLVAAAEEPLRRFEVTSRSGTLALYDGRDIAQNGWFVLREVCSPGVTRDAVVWLITPNAIPEWRRTPVIAVSQVGYHPAQVKQAILELDPRTETVDEVVLERLTPAGPEPVTSGMPERWGRFLAYEYAVFDFTSVEQPGLYRIRYGDQAAGPFSIDPHVYRNNVWQPTLETFFPAQMCHVAVRDGAQVWHGACHLDDALQAPAPHEHFDGYRQYGATDTTYKPHEHIPHLARGGWHDAGDYDLAAGSQAGATHTLALVRELFGVDTDQTTVDVETGVVLLHTPDGIPDIVAQVAHGVEALLGGYRASGHSFHGIIAATLEQYAHMGDASTMTDNCIYDAELGPDERRETPRGAFSGKMDDRWAFTNHDTALEYKVAAALAAASRVLREHKPSLAEECYKTAVQVWEAEHAREPVEQRAAYVPRGVEEQEVLAAVELFLAAGADRPAGVPYRDRLLALLPTVEAHAMRVGGAVARALPALDVGDSATPFARTLRAAIESALPELEAQLRATPFGIPFHPHVWGIGWQLLSYAVQTYQLWLALPDLIDRERVLRVLNYNLGCHPASNTSLVSGVGAVSSTVAYGTNRHEWSYIPGGVISGPALIRPDFMELKEPWPFLWQQTEYVIGGSADYIFCVLAADRMLNGSSS
jgi:endoglucanase